MRLPHHPMGAPMQLAPGRPSGVALLLLQLL
jgi:hypothetical protein